MSQKKQSSISKVIKFGRKIVRGIIRRLAGSVTEEDRQRIVDEVVSQINSTKLTKKEKAQVVNAVIDALLKHAQRLS